MFSLRARYCRATLCNYLSKTTKKLFPLHLFFSKQLSVTGHVLEKIKRKEKYGKR